MNIPSIINHNYYVVRSINPNKIWICEAKRFDDKENKLYYYYGTYELGSHEHKNNHYLSDTYYDILPNQNDEVRLATMEEIDILMDILEKNGIVTTLQEAGDKAKAPNLKVYKTNIIAAYEIDNWDEFCQDTVDQHYRNIHHNMYKDEFIKNINKFNQIINSVNPEDYDIIYKPAASYGDLFAVYCYYDANLSDDEINDFEDRLEECECIVHGSVMLPPYYWNHRKKYKLVVHPENKRLYTDKNYHERYFRKLKK